MEQVGAARGNAVELFEQGDILGFQDMPAGTEGVQNLTAAVEKRLLRLMYHQHGAEVEVGDRMLPNEGGVVALVLDDVNAEVVARVALAKLRRHVSDNKTAGGALG